MVEVRDITFAYNQNGNNIIKDISFDIEKNQYSHFGNNGVAKHR